MTTTRRTLTALATGALTLPFLSVPAAYAVAPEPPAQQSIAAVCENVPADFNPFIDDEPNTFTDAIECVAFAGIAQGGPNGRPSNQYGPALTVQRDQMASFIARTIDTADSLDTGTRVKALPAYDGSNAFTDVPAGNTHLQAINRLEAVGIVEGGPGGRPSNQYGPDLQVTRAQMASFINRAVAFMKGGNVANAGTSAGYVSDNDYFTDDESFQAHERNINGIASRGIAVGDGRDTYRPGQAIQRDQMAGFLARTLGALHQDGDIRPIAARIAVTPDAAVSLVAVSNPDSDASDDREYMATGLDNAKTYRITLVKSENVRSANGSFTFRGEADSGSSTGFSAVTGSPAADITRVNGTAVADSDTGTAGQQSGTTTATPTNGSITFTVDGDAAGETVVPVVYVNGGPGQTAENGGTSPRLEVRSASAGEFGAPIESFDVGGPITYTAAVAAASPVTTRPELVSTSVVRTFTDPGPTSSTADDRQRTEVRYTFDESIAGKAPTANLFHLVGFHSATRFDGQTAMLEPSGRSVLVTFGAAPSPTNPNGQNVGEAQLAEVSLATVDFDAVRDDAGAENPIGANPLGTQRTETSGEAGVTAAPDLQSVTGFTSAGQNATTVVFTFDERAFTLDNDGFRLVLTNNTEVVCTAVSGPAGGFTPENDTTKIDSTVETQCAAAVQATQVARGYVLAGTVSDEADDGNPVDGADGNTNPLQATQSPDAASSGPDLVSATFEAADANSDRVVYTFDEQVFVADDLDTDGPVDPRDTDTDGPGGANDFRVYTTSGGAGTTATTVGRSNDNPNQVIATFPNGTLSSAVGASVADSAVVGATGTANRTNRPDEVGVANVSSTTLVPGRTDGPDLTGVTVTSAGTAVYTFDEAVTPDSQSATGNVVENSFVLYLADGTRLRCDAATVGSGSAANQVTCDAFTVQDVATPGSATAAQVQSAVLGTVDNGAVRDTEGTANQNPEGARNTTGTTGTPRT